MSVLLLLLLLLLGLHDDLKRLEIGLLLLLGLNQHLKKLVTVLGLHLKRLMIVLVQMLLTECCYDFNGCSFAFHFFC